LSAGDCIEPNKKGLLGKYALAALGAKEYFRRRVFWIVSRKNLDPFAVREVRAHGQAQNLIRQLICYGKEPSANPARRKPSGDTAAAGNESSFRSHGFPAPAARGLFGVFE